MGAKSHRKGWLGEDRAEKWAQSNGWPAHKSGNQAHGRMDTPDVPIDFYGTQVYLEAKNVKSMPGKRLLADLAQAAGYCHQGEIPWLWYHVHGTSRDVIVMDKQHFEQSIKAAYAAGQRDGPDATDGNDATVDGEARGVDRKR